MPILKGIPPTQLGFYGDAAGNSPYINGLTFKKHGSQAGSILGMTKYSSDSRFVCTKQLRNGPRRLVLLPWTTTVIVKTVETRCLGMLTYGPHSPCTMLNPLFFFIRLQQTPTLHGGGRGEVWDVRGQCRFHVKESAMSTLYHLR